MTDNRIYIVTYNPLPFRYIEEMNFEELLKSSHTKVFTDFALAEKYHEDICTQLDADEDAEVMYRIHFIVKHLND